MNYFIVFRIYRLDTNVYLNLNLLDSCNQLYNYFHAYSFDKKICEILKSSKTEFGRNPSIR